MFELIDMVVGDDRVEFDRPALLRETLELRAEDHLV
jgi:hypothetical protein